MLLTQKVKIFIYKAEHLSWFWRYFYCHRLCN